MKLELNREVKLLIGLGVAVAILLLRLFNLQIIDSKYKLDAANNSMVYTITYPTRGIIYDRNGKILVGNQVAYDLVVTPREVEPFDTLTLARVLDVSPDFIRSKMKEYTKNRRSFGWRSIVMMRKIPQETYLRFSEVAYRFPGFKGQPRSIREYPYNAGGNLLGYVTEVDKKYIERHPNEYKPGDYAGKTGLEAAREKELRGEKGHTIWLRNSRNRIESRYKDGEMDKEAVPGKNIVTTIDAELQSYGQKLMNNKVGSLIAIEPSTGEILTMVASPGINVNVLSDIGKHYPKIAKNPHKPMFNRTVQASYPPGSVFKLVNALIGLQEGIITPYTQHPCDRGYALNDKKKVGCHEHDTPVDLDFSIMTSCNAYYCYMFREFLEKGKYGNVGETLNKWHEYATSFGFGKKLGSDFPAELGGFIPTSAYFDRYYGKNRWKATAVISMAIGQGEILCTPLHLANLCATIANRGHYYTPHIVKDSEDIKIDQKYHEKNYTMVDTVHFQKIIRGMYKAVNSEAGSGATASVAAVPGLEICGKTGTAQNPHGDDHSIFVCFAPKDNPKIAVVAYVENGGYGASYAAPIASLLTEMYLNKEISPERKDLEYRMKSANLMHKVKTR